MDCCFTGWTHDDRWRQIQYRNQMPTVWHVRIQYGWSLGPEKSKNSKPKRYLHTIFDSNSFWDDHHRKCPEPYLQSAISDISFVNGIWSRLQAITLDALDAFYKQIIPVDILDQKMSRWIKISQAYANKCKIWKDIPFDASNQWILETRLNHSTLTPKQINKSSITFGYHIYITYNNNNAKNNIDIDTDHIIITNTHIYTLTRKSFQNRSGMSTLFWITICFMCVTK